VTLDNLQVYLDGKAIDNWNQVVTALSEAYANKDVTASEAYASVSGSAISGGTASEYGVEQISNMSRFGRLP